MNTKREINNWGPVLFLVIYQILLLISLPFYFYFWTVQTSTVITAVVLLFLTGIGITGGYHRLYSHRTYRTNSVVEAIILFFATMGVQGSALRWCYDHRLHHANVDTDEDPYTITKGFWYAHCLWILEKPRTPDPKVVPDLMKNKLVMFQHNHYRKLILITNAIAFFSLAPLLGDWVGAFFLVIWTRMFLLHHFTWFINSLAHTWGDKPFSQEHTAVNNYVISLLTFGEGYHNYHHTFANDYRNGVRWYQYDPTKWLIWGLNKLGLAYDLKRTNNLAIKKKIVLEHKNLLLEKVAAYCHSKKDELNQQVDEISARIVEKINEFSQLKERYSEAKSLNLTREAVRQLKTEIKALKKSLKADWREWSQLSYSILYTQPA